MLKTNSLTTTTCRLNECDSDSRKSWYRTPEMKSLAIKRPILSGSVTQSEISVEPFENDDDINI